jgi:hypothetical protein
MDDLARDFRLFCDEYTSVRGLDPEIIYTCNFHEDVGPVTITVTKLRAAADRVVALEAERDRLAADNARLREREVELLEFIGEPVTLADLRASFDAARPYLDAYLRPGRAAGSTDSSTP